MVFLLEFRMEQNDSSSDQEDITVKNTRTDKHQAKHNSQDHNSYNRKKRTIPNIF